MITPDRVAELRELSKSDHVIIVGSEVRLLCGTIDALAAKLAQAEAQRDAAVSKLTVAEETAVVALTKLGLMQQQRDAALAERDRALSMDADSNNRINALYLELGALQRERDRMREALKQAISQLESGYAPTPLDGHRALIDKLKYIAGDAPSDGANREYEDGKDWAETHRGEQDEAP